MKFLKSQMALFLALCMLLTSANIVFAEEAADESAMIEDDGIFLSIDYEDEIPEFEKIEGAVAQSMVLKEDNGNHYFNVVPNWGNNGYKLKNVIPKNGGDYSLTFDFSLATITPPYAIMMLTEKATEVGEAVYHQFGLLGLAEDKQHFTVAGSVVEGITYQPNKWYKYSLDFNRAMLQLDVVISERDNEEVKGTYVGGPLRTESTWGRGLENSRTFDYLKFASEGDISIDNILLEESRKKPFSLTASSAHVGNIFSAKDKKQMNIKLKNVLLEPATAELTYKVLDEDGNQVDSGEIKGISAKPRETLEKPINVNVKKYGVYSLYCNITAKSETGEPVSYESERIAFSVANKREADEPLNPYTAVNIEYTDDFEQWTKVKELLMQAGASSVRKDFLWWEVEPEPGRYIAPTNTVAFQDMMDTGIGNMIILGSSNPSYNNNNWDNMRPDNIGTEEAWEGWANYVDHVSKTYKDQVTYYEVINEPNWSMTAENYYKYLKIAYPIIKKNDPDSIVAGLSTGSMPWAWIETVLSKISENPEKCIDVITLHPYDFDSTEEFGGLNNWSKLLRDQKLLDVLTRFNEMKKRYGLEDIPVQLTEMAITSTPGVSSTKQQAADMTQLYASTYAQGLLDKIFWYCFENTGICGANEVSTAGTEDNFGLVANRDDYVPYAAKPGYIALCGYNKMMTGAKPVDNIIEGWTSAYRFSRDNKKQVVMLWTENGSDNIALDLGAKNIEVFDKYTNPIGTMKSANGIYDFTSTFEPLYIVGDFTKLKRAKSTISVSAGEIYSVTGDMCEITITDSKKRNLKVEVSGTPYVTVEKNTGVIRGKGKLSLNVSDEAWQEEPVEVKIYDGNNLVYYTRMLVKIGDKGIDVKYSLGSDPTGKTNRSVINVSVTNKTSGIQLSGKVNADFSLVGGKNEKRNIVRLKPGETKTVYLNIPQSSAVHSIGTTLDLNFGGRFDFNQQISVISNMNVLKNETGKADISAFDIDLTKGDQYAANDALAASSIPNWGGPEDAGLRGTLRWDEKNLYVYTEMSDDVFYQNWTGFGVWEGDGLQLGIQDLATCSPGESAYTEIGISKTKNGNEFYRFSNQPGMDVPAGLVENCQLDIQLKPGKTVYKAVLPWSELIGRDTVSKGDKFLFSICANENDGSGRRGWVELTEGICTKKNAQLFNTIILN